MVQKVAVVCEFELGLQHLMTGNLCLPSSKLVPFSESGKDKAAEGERWARAAMVRGKYLEKMKFFPAQEKVREFCGWPGKFRKDLESQGKVREFENKWLWQAVFRKFIYSVQAGKGDSLSSSVSSLRATLKGKNLLPWGTNSFL